MLIRNRDWKNWQEIMDPAPTAAENAAGNGAQTKGPRKRAVTRVRPGHADLTGLLKYDRDDARDILERASARETTARVAVGAICRRLLAEFGVSIGSHIIRLGDITADVSALPADINAAADESPLRTLDHAAETRMIERIDVEGHPSLRRFGLHDPRRAIGVDVVAVDLLIPRHGLPVYIAEVHACLLRQPDAGFISGQTITSTTG